VVAISKIIQQNFQMAKKIDKLLSIIMEKNINTKSQVDESFIEVINKITLI